jgi:hypothetical protein
MDAFHTLVTFNHEQLAATEAAADSEKEGALDAVKAAGEFVSQLPSCGPTAERP